MLGNLDSNQEQLIAISAVPLPRNCSGIPRISTVFIGRVYALAPTHTGPSWPRSRVFVSFLVTEPSRSRVPGMRHTRRSITACAQACSRATSQTPGEPPWLLETSTDRDDEPTQCGRVVPAVPNGRAGHHRGGTCCRNHRPNNVEGRGRPHRPKDSLQPGACRLVLPIFGQRSVTEPELMPPGQQRLDRCERGSLAECRCVRPDGLRRARHPR